MTGRDGFAQVLLAEWTKLRSVGRWVLGMIAAVMLTVLISVLAASGGVTDSNDVPDLSVGPDGLAVTDDFHFVHRPLSGDGSVTTRVLSQENSHEWAKAGVLIKDGTRTGSRYAAMMVTPGHGVRLQSNFATDVAGGPTAVSRWLRLTRTGSTITGAESADGATWNTVGTVQVNALPDTVEVGLFVASPPRRVLDRQVGSTSVGFRPTVGTASFDNVRVEPPQPPVPWRDQDVGWPLESGDSTETGGTFTVTGSGDIGPDPPSDDVVQISLTGAFVGLMAIVALSVLFITSEYRRGMIRTTFVASPRRGRVLAAKAIVIGAVTFLAALVACVAAFLVALPILRSNGFAPPAFPEPALGDPTVLRAVVGTAALMALVAMFSLGVGAILRRSAGAITVIIALLIIPLIVSTALPLEAGRWLMRITPAAGFAIQRTIEPTDDTVVAAWTSLAPWTGLAVLCGYAVVTLAGAYWLLRRRDA